MNKTLIERLYHHSEGYNDSIINLARHMEYYRSPQHVALFKSIIKRESDSKILQLAIEVIIKNFKNIYPQPIYLKRHPKITVGEWVQSELEETLKDISSVADDAIEDITDVNGETEIWDNIPPGIKNEIYQKADILADNLIKNRNSIKQKLEKYTNEFSPYNNMLLKDYFKDIKPREKVIYRAF